jgi:hypothetical protein
VATKGMVATKGTPTRLPAVLTDWAADLRAGRIGARGWDSGVEPGWAASGAMALTGHPDGPPLGLTVPFVAPTRRWRSSAHSRPNSAIRCRPPARRPPTRRRARANCWASAPPRSG